jgi:hypothetical protein
MGDARRAHRARPVGGPKQIPGARNPTERMT